MTPPAENHFCARILDRRDVSEDLCILRINPGGPLAYRAGQYATLGIDREGVRTERAYSIASSPWEEALEIFIELVPNGHLTPNLFELQPGDTLLCRKAAKALSRLDERGGSPARESPALLSARRQPRIRVWLPRGARALLSGSTLVQICRHGEPPLGGSRVARRAGPRG